MVLNSSVFAVVGTIALAVCVLCLIVLHLVPSGLYPVRDPVSLYGTTRYHLLYRVQAITSGICALCLLIALAEQQNDLPVFGLLMLGCYGISRILIAAFMMDAYGKHTRKGFIHIFLAAVAFTTIAIAVGFLTAPLVVLPFWSELRVFLLLAEYLTIISTILFFFISLISSLRRYTGLIERGIYLGALCWLGLAIIPLIH